MHELLSAPQQYVRILSYLCEITRNLYIPFLATNQFIQIFDCGMLDVCNNTSLELDLGKSTDGELGLAVVPSSISCNCHVDIMQLSCHHHRYKCHDYGMVTRCIQSRTYLGGGIIRPVSKFPIKFQLAERHQLPIDPLHTAPKHGIATPNHRLGLGRALCESLDLASLGEALKYVLGPSVEGFLEVQCVCL